MYRIAFAALVASFATGCTPLVGALVAIELLDRDPVYYDDFAESNAEGTMRGDIPEGGTFDRQLTRATIWNYDQGLDFDLHTTAETWVMLTGGFSADLEDGETVVLGPDEHWIIGCSGPSEYDAMYDQPAEEVEITRELVEIEGETMIQLTIEASFGPDGTVTAVVVQPQPNPDEDDA
ncbi:MAG: hypothetical protein H6737_14990 [Alphaproteobacteria bacterium]|nr:hypothetical protein [Alphaproteobacteria bacterium]